MNISNIMSTIQTTFTNYPPPRISNICRFAPENYYQHCQVSLRLVQTVAVALAIVSAIKLIKLHTQTDPSREYVRVPTTQLDQISDLMNKTLANFKNAFRKMAENF